MRRHPKAPFAGSAEPPAGSIEGRGSTRARRSLFGAACLCVLGLVAFLGSSAPSAGAVAAPGQVPGRGFLPDNRGWELVSNVPQKEKNGVDVLVRSSRARAAADGNAFQYASLLGSTDAEGVPFTSEYMTTRSDAAGWTVHPITPAQESLSIREVAFKHFEPRYEGDMSADLGKGVFLAKTSLTESPNEAAAPNLYLRDDLRSPTPGHYRLLTEAAAPQQAGPGIWPVFVGASSDFSHVFFESARDLSSPSPAPLSAFCLQFGFGCPPVRLYEWAEGEVRLAGILPESLGGGPAESSGAARANTSEEFGPLFYAPRSVSSDGSRVIFTVPASADPSGTRQVYVRDSKGTVTTADDETTLVSNGIDSTDYWDASADASKVFFTANGHLYRFDLNAPPSEEPVQIDVDEEPADTSSVVDGVIGASADGSYVYFLERSQLVAGGGTAPFWTNTFTAERIYVWHEGTIHEVGGVNGSELPQILGTSGSNLTPKWSSVTPDGTHAIFITQGSDELTGYDHGSGCPNLTAPECDEVYVYSATANGGEGELQCASCNPSGAPATADADIYSEFATSATNPTAHLSHALSDDGRYVFFTSGESLVEEDTNGASDAYEYDTATEEVHLISAGTGDDPSFFLDASADGSDAFFATREQLVGADTDQSMDVYDARIDGGQPEPPASPPPCAGADACHGSSPAAPVPPNAASAALVGPGNQKAHRHKAKHKKKRSHHKRHAKRAGGNQGGSK